MSEPLDSPDLIFFNYLLNRKWRMSVVHTYGNPPGRDTFYILHPIILGDEKWYLLKKQYIRTSILCIAFGDAVDDPVDEASANVPVHPASEIWGSVD